MSLSVTDLAFTQIWLEWACIRTLHELIVLIVVGVVVVVLVVVVVVVTVVGVVVLLSVLHCIRRCWDHR